MSRPESDRYYNPLGAREKLREMLFLLRANVRQVRSSPFAMLLEEIDEYRVLLRKYSGVDLQKARIFEIGFGRRPDRLVALMSEGADASGVDLYAPLLGLTPAELLKAFRTNGFESAARSLARYLLFDIVRYREFARELSRRGRRLRIERRGFLVHDIATLELGERQFDVILSEDVFEHIAEKELHVILPKLSKWLKPSGICLIRPDIFTGVWGGHLCGRIYSGSRQPTAIEPWEHLRKNRFQSAVYVNRLTRRQYRELFGRYFEVIEERVKDPSLGRELLTPEIARELHEYSEEELLSNRVLFVLRPRRSSRA